MTLLVNKGYKFRIYPNKTQCESIARIFGCYRFVYNRFLSKAISDYETTGKSNSAYDNQKELTLLKKDPDFAWLKESDSQALNQSIFDLKCAYDRFFKKLGGYPKFKKKTNNQSYTTCVTGGQLQIVNNKIYIPKVGWVKIKQHRPITGRVTAGTVSKTASGKYFIALHCKECPVEELDKVHSDIGIDLGLSSLITTNAGVKVNNPKHIKKYLSKIEREQKKLSKKNKGSNNYIKQRIKLAKLHEKVSNQRKDFTHRLTHQLVKNHDFIAVEDLSVKSMLESDLEGLSTEQVQSFHRNISDVSWSELIRQLEYKSEWYGRKFVQVDRYFPSSQLCSCCHYKNTEVKDLKIRKWTCPRCGSIHDRDQNAAKNILAEAIRISN